ncbi:DUF6907 domain-containing protein [Streptomyces collinus]|uniref:DUF6907 domain-containing protein n=1 Tax=Streptomyces collinus TaxID=42684 RepID=UPI0036C0ED3A
MRCADTALRGFRHTVACPSWCTTDHTLDTEGKRHPVDVYHQLCGAVAYAEYAEVYEDYASWQLLSAHFVVRPGSSRRWPGSWKSIRAMHPRLTTARAEWAVRTNTTTNAEVA